MIKICLIVVIGIEIVKLFLYQLFPVVLAIEVIHY